MRRIPDRPAASYDQVAAHYAVHRQVHPGVLHALCQRISRVSRVLEVGCGTANYLGALQERVGCICCGLDPSAQMLSRAARRWPGLGLARGTAEQLAVGDSSFDLVFSVDVIHHVSERETFLRRAWRSLVPGGHCCTVTDSEDIIRRRHPLATYFPETVSADLARYPRIRDLWRWMATAGFVAIACHTVEHAYWITDVYPYRDQAYSVLGLIRQKGFRRGLKRMERDLSHGPLLGVSRYALLWGTRPAFSGRSTPLRQHRQAQVATWREGRV